MSLAAILSLTYKHLCQNGVSITFLPDKASDISNLDPIGRIVHASLAIIDVLQTTSDSKIDFVCPGDTGIFAGQICTITTSSSDPEAITASVNGGLYIVAAFWTSTGLNNPFALVYNIMIGTCWTVVCLMLPIFIPPVRRFRDVLRKLIIPGILSGVAAQLDSKCKEECNDGDEVNPFLAERQNLSTMGKKLSPKKNARLLYFEPRLCHDPVIDHIPYMETFLNNIHSAVLILYNYSGYRQESDDDEPNHFETTKVLRTVASAVEKNDLSILEEVDVKTINWDDTEGGLDELSLSAIFRDVVSSIYSSSRLWIEAYNNIDIKDEEKHRVTTVRRILKAWFANAICACDSITSSWPFIAIRMFQGKQGAGLQNVSTRRFIMTILWSVKWTGGAVALACVEIWGGLYADWLVRSEMASPDYALLGTMRGWALFAYFLAFQFSMEGTIKKGMMRALGTCLGGFAAWIGIMLCSFSYNGINPVNPYAWVAYLTVCLFIGNFAGKGTGVTAFMGWDYDTPFISFYFNLTLNIVGMGAFYGSFTVNAGTASRILVNLCGIAMAILVSIIPPYYSGKDPTWLIDYCEELQKFHRSVALEYIDNRDISMETIVQLGVDIECMRRKAAIVLTDASRWSALPYFRTPPELLKIMDVLIAEEGHLISVYKHLIETKCFQSVNYDLLRPAYEEALEGKDETAPATSKFLNEAGERNCRLLRSFINRLARLQTVREKLDSFKQASWFLMS